MKEDCQRWVVLFFNDLQWLIINNYKYLYYKSSYNFRNFVAYESEQYQRRRTLP